jgi:hypothetical protein
MDYREYRENESVAAVLNRLEQDDRLRVDMSVLDELNNYTVYGKRQRDIASARYKTREDLHVLASQYETTQMYRSRVCRIRTGHLSIQRVLKRMWSMGLASVYGIEAVRKLSPAPNRDAVMNTILEPLRERLDDCELIVETAAEVEKLLSNAYFTLKELRGINEAFLDERRKDRNV